VEFVVNGEDIISINLSLFEKYQVSWSQTTVQPTDNVQLLFS
jgi:hypothetical protein